MSSENLKKQREVLDREGLDALVAVSPENIGYTAGYMIPSQLIPIRKRLFFTVVSPTQARLLVASVELNEALASSKIRDIHAYNEFTENSVDVLADTLREFGVDRGRVGIELDFLPARHYSRLQQVLPNMSIVDAEDIYDHMRMVKTKEEIEILRRAARIVNDTHADVYQNAKPGMTEMDIAFLFIEGVLKRGCEEMRKLVVGSGPRSVYAISFL